MTKLLWGQPGDRIYETGLDRGVLYLSGGSGVPWGGLTEVDEGFGDEATESRYYDGIKYLDEALFGDFTATLRALTYPDEFLDSEGVGSIGNGLFVDDQSPKPFGLSYRTLVGSDTEEAGEGYKIHVLYNLTATPSSESHETLSDSVDPLEFSWEISSVPEEVSGYRPTSHIIFDSRFLTPSQLQSVEDLLYGNAVEDARLPSLSEFVDLLVTP